MKATHPISSIMVSLCLLVVLTGEGRSQSSPILPVQTGPMGREHMGWRLYNAAASFGYSTLAFPNSSNAIAFGLERLKGDYDGTMSTAFGYNYADPKGSISLLYAPSYVSRVRYSDLSSFNHSLNFKGFLKVSRRWDLSMAFAGTDSTLDQLLFSPAILSSAANPLPTLDDLIQTARIGEYTSDQLASMLTGTPYVATPARSIIYGTRYLSTSLSSSASYRHSPRLSYTFTARATRSQTRNETQQELQNQLNFLIPQSTTKQVGVSVDYSRSPRTQIGLESTSTEVDSSIARYIIANPNVFLSRKLSPHWFIRISGGPGFIRVLRIDPRFVRQAGEPFQYGYTAQSNVGYTVRDQRLIGSYARMLGDTYGFGSQSSEMFGGSWQWSRPGGSWTFYASGSLQRLFGGVLGDIHTWYGNAGFARSLSRQLSFNFTYGYVARQTATTGNAMGMIQEDLNGSSFRVTLVWNPQGNREAHVAGLAPR